VHQSVVILLCAHPSKLRCARQMSLNDRTESENMMASKRKWRGLFRVVATGTVAAGLGVAASAYAAGEPI
jgi:hypothetical protein